MRGRWMVGLAATIAMGALAVGEAQASLHEATADLEDAAGAFAKVAKKKTKAKGLIAAAVKLHKSSQGLNPGWGFAWQFANVEKNFRAVRTRYNKNKKLKHKPAVVSAWEDLRSAYVTARFYAHIDEIEDDTGDLQFRANQFAQAIGQNWSAGLLVFDAMALKAIVAGFADAVDAEDPHEALDRFDGVVHTMGVIADRMETTMVTQKARKAHRKLKQAYHALALTFLDRSDDEDDDEGEDECDNPFGGGFGGFDFDFCEGDADQDDQDDDWNDDEDDDWDDDDDDWDDDEDDDWDDDDDDDDDWDDDEDDDDQGGWGSWGNLGGSLNWQ